MLSSSHKQPHLRGATPPRQSMQYIFYYPDWQLVSDQANFCLDSDPLILGISEAIRHSEARSHHLFDTNRAEMGGNEPALHQIELPRGGIQVAVRVLHDTRWGRSKRRRSFSL